MGDQNYWFKKLEALQEKNKEKIMEFVESVVKVVSSKSLNDSVKKDLDESETMNKEQQQKVIAENTQSKKIASQSKKSGGTETKNV